MSFKKIQTVKWTIEETNKHISQNFDSEYWEFLIKKISYKEISYDKKAKIITFPSYIPLKSVVQEVLNEIKEGYIALSSCGICKNFFDINKENGIFGDPQNLTGYICDTCSKNLTAKDFYENYLKI